MPNCAVRVVLSAAIGCAVASAVAPAGRAAGSQPFDGTWNVVVDCAQAPDGARPYRWRFPAEVRGGSLLGQFRHPEMNASGTLSGQILPNGDAFLRMNGNTGSPQYTLGRVAAGTPFHYTVTAHFGQQSGSGRRNERRQCDLTFTRD